MAEGSIDENEKRGALRQIKAELGPPIMEAVADPSVFERAAKGEFSDKVRAVPHDLRPLVEEVLVREAAKRASAPSASAGTPGERLRVVKSFEEQIQDIEGKLKGELGRRMADSLHRLRTQYEEETDPTRKEELKQALSMRLERLETTLNQPPSTAATVGNAPWSPEDLAVVTAADSAEVDAKKADAEVTERKKRETTTPPWNADDVKVADKKLERAKAEGKAEMKFSKKEMKQFEGYLAKRKDTIEAEADPWALERVKKLNAWWSGLGWKKKIAISAGMIAIGGGAGALVGGLAGAAAGLLCANEARRGLTSSMLGLMAAPAIYARGRVLRTKVRDDSWWVTKKWARHPGRTAIMGGAAVAAGAYFASSALSQGIKEYAPAVGGFIAEKSWEYLPDFTKGVVDTRDYISEKAIAAAQAFAETGPGKSVTEWFEGLVLEFCDDEKCTDLKERITVGAAQAAEIEDSTEAARRDIAVSEPSQVKTHGEDDYGNEPVDTSERTDEIERVSKADTTPSPAAIQAAYESRNRIQGSHDAAQLVGKKQWLSPQEQVTGMVEPKNRGIGNTWGTTSGVEEQGAALETSGAGGVSASIGESNEVQMARRLAEEGSHNRAFLDSVRETQPAANQQRYDPLAGWNARVTNTAPDTHYDPLAGWTAKVPEGSAVSPADKYNIHINDGKIGTVWEAFAKMESLTSEDKTKIRTFLGEAYLGEKDKKFEEILGVHPRKIPQDYVIPGERILKLLEAAGVKPPVDPEGYVPTGTVPMVEPRPLGEGTPVKLRILPDTAPQPVTEVDQFRKDAILHIDGEAAGAMPQEQTPDKKFEGYKERMGNIAEEIRKRTAEFLAQNPPLEAPEPPAETSEAAASANQIIFEALGSSEKGHIKGGDSIWKMLTRKGMTVPQMGAFIGELNKWGAEDIKTLGIPSGDPSKIGVDDRIVINGNNPKHAKLFEMLTKAGIEPGIAQVEDPGVATVGRKAPYLGEEQIASRGVQIGGSELAKADGPEVQGAAVMAFEPFSINATDLPPQEGTTATNGDWTPPTSEQMATAKMADNPTIFERFTKVPGVEVVTEDGKSPLLKVIGLDGKVRVLRPEEFYGSSEVASRKLMSDLMTEPRYQQAFDGLGNKNNTTSIVNQEGSAELLMRYFSVGPLGSVTYDLPSDSEATLKGFSRGNTAQLRTIFEFFQEVARQSGIKDFKATLPPARGETLSDYALRLEFHTSILSKPMYTGSARSFTLPIPKAA